MGLSLEATGPHGSVPEFLRKHKAHCDFPGGVQTPLGPSMW